MRFMAYRITAGSLARVSSEDVTDIAPVAGKTAEGLNSRARHAFHSGGKVYLSDLGTSFAAYDAPSGGTMARSSADDFDLGTVSWPSSLDTRRASDVGWVERGAGSTCFAAQRGSIPAAIVPVLTFPTASRATRLRSR